MVLTREEFLRALCTHRLPNQGWSLMVNNDNTLTCSICGETFYAENIADEDIRIAIDNVKTILQSVKTFYHDMPRQTAREYFQIIPLLDKLEKLYKIARDSFNRNNPFNTQNRNFNQRFDFNLFNNLTRMGAMFGANPGMMYQQPMPQAQPGFGGPPMMNQNMFQQQQMGNPFGAGYDQMANMNPCQQCQGFQNCQRYRQCTLNNCQTCGSMQECYRYKGCNVQPVMFNTQPQASFSPPQQSMYQPQQQPLITPQPQAKPIVQQQKAPPLPDSNQQQTQSTTIDTSNMTKIYNS